MSKSYQNAESLELKLLHLLLLDTVEVLVKNVSVSFNRVLSQHFCKSSGLPKRTLVSFVFKIVLKLVLLFLELQADVLARYKPTINTTLLIPELKRADNLAADALQYFNSTRHIVLYYEDLVNNHTVSFLQYIKNRVYYKWRP